MYPDFFAQGTYTTAFETDFSPLAQCDITQLFVDWRDLVPQKVYAGGLLIDSGLYGHKDFVDDPNPYFNPPPVYGDPTPVMNARPPKIDWLDG
jgi:hypothetical protein